MHQQYLKFTLLALFVSLTAVFPPPASHAQSVCTGEFIPVSQPLNDLGSGEYVRMDGTATGVIGGLYPGGSNVRPAAHEAAGIALAQQITPLNENGQPSENGRIVLISAGMSNTAAEFIEFVRLWRVDDSINTQLAIVNGAQPGQTAEIWADPNAQVWQDLINFLATGGLTPLQVQVAWVKLTHIGPGDFPIKAEVLQADLEHVARNLKLHFPNLQIAYFSSRTRSYTYWQGLSPEPAAFETAFAVRWMLEKQISGDATLNFNPNNGPAVAPYLSWGPYLWIDGLNPRSDGLIWPQTDLVGDCTHPSDSGELKVAHMLMDFFKTDTTSVSWFLSNPIIPTPTPIPLPTSTPVPASSPTATSIPQPSPSPSSTPAISNPPIFLPYIQAVATGGSTETDESTPKALQPKQKFAKNLNKKG